MSNHIHSQFNIETWDETPYSQSENGPELIRASVTQSYTGDLDGEGVLEYLMTTFDENFSRFMGIERIVGRMDGRKGSFVLDHKGTHESGVAKSSFQIVENSGTGELGGIQGEGHFKATHEEALFELDYYF